MRRIIRLKRSQVCWEADFVGDLDVVKAFGTTTVPTPFLPSMAAEEVQERIRKLNPNCIVEVADEKNHDNNAGETILQGSVA